MSENHDSAAADRARKASTAPGLEGEGGQYVEGDYGDAGVVGGVDEPQPEGGDYPEGDYGDAGTAGAAREEDAIREGLTDGQVNTTDEERGPLHG
jgi:hypothetical protein